MIITLLASAWAAETPKDSYINNPESAWVLEPRYELGILLPVYNQIQLGKDGTNFSYVEDAGQDNLFAYQRLQLDFRYKGRHSFIFMKQPLDLKTTRQTEQELTIDYAVFPQGTPVEYRFGFDYYRASYLFDLSAKDNVELSIGCSLQIRNATYDFTSLNGEIQNTVRDIGPVPLLKVRGRWDLEKTWWEFEADGAYAPIKYLNGDVSDVVGALLDTSIKGGFYFNRGLDTFISLRYVGGGAEGTDSDPDPNKDGFVANWVHFGALSIGFLIR